MKLSRYLRCMIITVAMCYMVYNMYYILSIVTKSNRLTHTRSEIYTDGKYELRSEISTDGKYEIDSELSKDGKRELLQLVNDEKSRKSQLNCHSIFNGDQMEISKANTLKYANYSSYFIKKTTQDCDTYRTLRGYATDSGVSNDEQLFPLAFSIVAHDQPDAFERLIRLIYRPHNFYCVHVDRKSPMMVFQAIAGIVRCLPNVFLVSKREIAVYASITVLQAHLTCFSDLLKFKWEYLINYSGTELPLRPNNQLVQILRLHDGVNNIQSIPYGNLTQIQKGRWISRYETIIDEKKRTGKLVRIGARKEPPPFSLTITKNIITGAFSRAFVVYLFNDEKALTFLKWVKYTYVPEEHFFGTLNNGIENRHMNAPGAYTGDFPQLEYIMRYTNWAYEPREFACHGSDRHNICVFGVGDLPYLATRKYLIANKFSLTNSPAAVDCVDWLVESRRRETEHSYLDFYASMFSDD